MIPTGALMKNTDCQLTFSTSTPPTIGPAALDRPMMAPQAPIAMFSFSPGKAPRSRARAAGWSRAPNRPWSTRRPISQPMAQLLAEADADEDSANPATPIRKTRLCPNRSPACPP